MEGLLGIPLKNLRKLMRENNYRIDSPYRKKFSLLILFSIRNSYFARKESQLFSDKIQQANVPSLIFILGHWRSGTTLLHNLMSLNDEYAYPNQFQVSKPYVFLSREAAVARAFAQASSQRRVMDDVSVNYDSPGEDESALAVGSLRSPYLGWTFPARSDFYNRYLTFNDTSQTENDEWYNFLLYFLKKLSIRYNGKPLILKSPTHTGRIKNILRYFPDAKFLHIHRNPFSVFQSTRKFYQEAMPDYYLQTPSNNGQYTDEIINRYRLMYDSFFDQSKLIPSSNYFEVGYEELVKDKVGTVLRIHDSMQLSGADKAEPKISQYVESIKHYQKNTYNDLESDLKKKIVSSWQQSFDTWGYLYS
jgi:hypothetical protein